MLPKNLKEVFPKFDKFPSIVCFCCNSKDQTDSENIPEDESSERPEESSKGTNKGAEKNEDQTLQHRKRK